MPRHTLPLVEMRCAGFVRHVAVLAGAPVGAVAGIEEHTRAAAHIRMPHATFSGKMLSIPSDAQTFTLGHPISRMTIPSNPNHLAPRVGPAPAPGCGGAGPSTSIP